MRLVIAIVARNVHRAWHKKDDLIGEALLSLVEAVDRFPIVAKDNNIVPYIVKTVSYRLRSAIRTNIVKERTARRTGQVIELRQLTKKISKHLTVEHKVYKFELDEIAAKAVETEEEETILDLCLQGYKDREIGEVIGKSNSYVAKRRYKVFERFRYYYER